MIFHKIFFEKQTNKQKIPIKANIHEHFFTSLQVPPVRRIKNAN